MSHEPVAVTAETFEQEVLNAEGPVLVDFWAEWCAPCKSIAPLLEDIADEQGERLKVAKLDVDAYGDVAARYRVRSIPTLMMFRDGEPVGTQIGAVGARELNGFIDNHA